MKKFLGTTWDDWVSIFVAVSVAEMARDAFKPEGALLDFVIFIIGWFIGFTICKLLINQILKWTGKN
jgi:hypothetical protein